MTYYLVGLVTALQKDAKASHDRIEQVFGKGEALVFITDEDERTGYHDISERFQGKLKPFDEDRLLERLEKERAWVLAMI